MTVLHFWLDFDGCASGAIKLKEYPLNSEDYLYYADINHPLLIDIVNTIENKLKFGAVKVIISSGSNRQTFENEAVIARKHIFATNQQLITCASIQGLCAIYRTLKSFFASQPKVHLFLDRYLLEDTFLTLQPGATWQNIERYLYELEGTYPLTMRQVNQLPQAVAMHQPGDRCVNYFDNEKLVLLYTKAHRAISYELACCAVFQTLPNIEVHFYDDKDEILTGIQKAYAQAPHLLPAQGNFTLFLKQCDSLPVILNPHAAMSPIKGLPPLKGTGPTNKYWYQALLNLKQQFTLDFNGSVSYRKFYGSESSDTIGSDRNINATLITINGYLYGYSKLFGEQYNEGIVQLKELDGPRHKFQLTFTNQHHISNIEIILTKFGNEQRFPGLFADDAAGEAESQPPLYRAYVVL